MVKSVKGQKLFYSFMKIQELRCKYAKSFGIWDKIFAVNSLKIEVFGTK